MFDISLVCMSQKRQIVYVFTYILCIFSGDHVLFLCENDNSVR